MYLRPLLALLLLAALVGACGGDDADDDAQEGPGATTVVGGDLDEVPVPPRAEPLGPLDEREGGVLVRSYEVRGMTLRAVMRFYEEVFADRAVLMPVRDVPGAATVLRAEWRLDEGVLRVTTQEAPTLEQPDGGGGPVTQLSLQLTPT